MTRYSRGPLVSVANLISLLMLQLVIFNITDAGVLHGLWLGDIIAIIASVSFVATWMGWWFREQPMVEAGLLIASFTYVMRGSFILVTDGPFAQPMWTSFTIGAIAGVCFWYEVRDPRDRRGP